MALAESQLLTVEREGSMWTWTVTPASLTHCFVYELCVADKEFVDGIHLLQRQFCTAPLIRPWHTPAPT